MAQPNGSSCSLCTRTQGQIILSSCCCSKDQPASTPLYLRPWLSFSTCRKAFPPLASYQYFRQKKKKEIRGGNACIRKAKYFQEFPEVFAYISLKSPMSFGLSCLQEKKNVNFNILFAYITDQNKIKVRQKKTRRKTTSHGCYKCDSLMKMNFYHGGI